MSADAPAPAQPEQTGDSEKKPTDFKSLFDRIAKRCTQKPLEGLMNIFGAIEYLFETDRNDENLAVLLASECALRAELHDTCRSFFKKHPPAAAASSDSQESLSDFLLPKHSEELLQLMKTPSFEELRQKKEKITRGVTRKGETMFSQPEKKIRSDSVPSIGKGLSSGGSSGAGTPGDDTRAPSITSDEVSRLESKGSFDSEGSASDVGTGRKGSSGTIPSSMIVDPATEESKRSQPSSSMEQTTASDGATAGSDPSLSGSDIPGKKNLHSV